MTEISCLNCATELPQTKGKRKKQFCNSTCRSNYWQKQKRKLAAANTIPLPKDYVNVKKVKILKPDGTTSPLHLMPKGLSTSQQLQWRLDHSKNQS